MSVVGPERGVLVTGATSGLGRAVALGFAARGVPVAIVGRSEEALRQVTRDVRDHDVRVVALQADLSDAPALVVWMATAPGGPVLNEVTVTPLREQGWP